MNSESPSVALIAARELNATHIGTTIRFVLRDNRNEIITVVTGELRQIGHHQGLSRVIYGIGGGDESRLHPDQPVSLNPPGDFHDVQELALFDNVPQ